MSGALVEVRQVTKQFGTSWALNGLSLTLEPEKQYALQGPSGSGKSTLLYLLAGLDHPTAGEIIVDGQNLSYLDENAAYYRQQVVGLVFQFHFLLPTLNCLDNIYLPARISGTPVAKISGEVQALAQELEVEACLKKFPYQLSGGEQQRINIIRALSLSPRLLLCDEPTGNLDSANAQKVASLLAKLAAEKHMTLAVVTHDDAVASHFADRLYLRDGRLDEHPPKA